MRRLLVTWIPTCRFSAGSCTLTLMIVDWRFKNFVMLVRLASVTSGPTWHLHLSFPSCSQ